MTPRPDGIWRFVKPGPTLGDSAFMTFSRVGDGTKKRNLFARQQELSKNLSLAMDKKLGPSFQLQKWLHAYHALTAQCSNTT
jgi:hypothetical protein